MAQYSKHPVSAPPGPPPRARSTQLLLRGWSVFVLVCMFTAGAWNNVFGPVGVAVVTAITLAGSIVLWCLLPLRDASGGRFTWRRLPWFLVGYVILAGVSLLWSAWPATTAITWALLVSTTVQGFFIAAMMSWRDIMRTLASALRWVLGLSLVFELWVALVVRHPVLPPFIGSDETTAAHPSWSEGNLIDGGRIQGLVGDSNLLAMICVLALVVFTLVALATITRPAWSIAWIILAAFLLWRAASVTAYLAVAAIILVLATALIMRRASAPRSRTVWYIAYAAVAAIGFGGVWLMRDALFGALGRTSDLTGREAIWSAVSERAGERPVLGWGFATPWLPWDPQFDGWIVDHGITVLHAHSALLDVRLQLGAVGLVVFWLVVLSFIWRSWFFAVDRPRWDLVAERPYSPLSLMPTLFATMMLVQGVAESRPLMEWGWCLLALFAFKIKLSPNIGVGSAEQSLAIERGEQPRQRR